MKYLDIDFRKEYKIITKCEECNSDLEITIDQDEEEMNIRVDRCETCMYVAMDEGREEGRDEVREEEEGKGGYHEGRKEGFDEGFAEGEDVGYKKGLEEEKSEG